MLHVDTYFRFETSTGKFKIVIAFFINRQESQKQVCSCPVDREELVRHTVGGLVCFDITRSSVMCIKQSKIKIK